MDEGKCSIYLQNDLTIPKNLIYLSVKIKFNTEKIMLAVYFSKISPVSHHKASDSTKYLCFINYLKKNSCIPIIYCFLGIFLLYFLVFYMLLRIKRLSVFKA